MSAQEQARTRMMIQQHQVKNRQQSMLARAAAELGADDFSGKESPCVK